MEVVERVREGDRQARAAREDLTGISGDQTDDGFHRSNRRIGVHLTEQAAVMKVAYNDNDI